MYPSAQPVPEMTRAKAFRRLALLLAGAAVLYGVGITWGLPSWRGWAVDELHPESWEVAVSPETPTGWHARYPPLHFSLLHNLSQPFRWAIDRGWIELDEWRANLWLTLGARLLSVLMALATLLVVYAIGSRLAGRRTGLFAALIAALMANYVYYAKMANLESPYLLWIALSLLFYLRLLDRAGLSDAILFGLFTAAAVATKDQAYALYALAPFPLLVALARHRASEGRTGGDPNVRAAEGGASGFVARLARALFDRRFLAAGASGALGYGLFQNAIGNPGRFRHHVELLLGPMSDPYREFGHGLGDQLALAGRFLGQIVFVLDPLLFVACVAGVVWVALRARRGGAAEKREAFLLGSLLLFAVSYYLALIAVIGFTFDRYVLPVTMLLALAGGRCFALLIEHPPRLLAGRRRWVTAAIAAVFVYAGLYAFSIDARMLADSRYDVEAWITERAGSTESALAVGRPKHVPRIRTLSWPRVRRSEGRVLLRHDPRFVVINLTDLRGAAEEAFVARLDSGELGYRRVLTHRGDPIVDLLDLEGVGSAQRFVNPELAVWERIQTPPSPG